MKTRDPKQIAAAIKNRIELAQARMIAELAQTQILSMRRRIARGIGVLDAPMPPYPKGYAAKKAASGRQSSVRDLMWSGRMLASMVVRVEGTHRARISFSDAKSVEKARKNQRRSPWFGVSPSDRARLIDQARVILKALLKNT